MEFLTGVKQQKMVRITDIVTEGVEGKTVFICGSVHAIRKKIGRAHV